MISQPQKGFTLVELMIVIAIIGILVVALFPFLTTYLSRAEDVRIRVQLTHIAGAFENYMITNHTWVLSNSYGGGSGSIDYDPTLVSNSIITTAYAIGEPSAIRQLEILGYITTGYIQQTNNVVKSKYMIEGCDPMTFSVGAKVVNQNTSDFREISYACNGTINALGTENTMSTHMDHPMNTAITRGNCTSIAGSGKNCGGIPLSIPICINGATNYPTCDMMPS